MRKHSQKAIFPGINCPLDAVACHFSNLCILLLSCLQVMAKIAYHFAEILVGQTLVNVLIRQYR